MSAELRMAGFSGVGQWIELDYGYFFPQRSLDSEVEALVAVSVGVQFVFGAPGLLLAPPDRNGHRCLDIGLFIGRVPKEGYPIDVS